MTRWTSYITAAPHLAWLVIRIFRQKIRSVRGRIVEKPRFHDKLEKQIPLLIYQMGKVASVSVYQAILKQYAGVVVRSHFFSENDSDWRVRALYRWVKYENGPLRVISLTREPIERNISAFFQNFKRDTGVPYYRNDYSIDELRSIFLKKNDHNVPLTWFQNSVYHNFEIDVYAKPFPREGFQQYSKDNIELLVIRSEIDNTIKIEAISKFLGLNDLSIKQKNVGHKKDYARTYDEFLDQVKLPRDYIEMMCESQYYRHFYSSDDIHASKRRWERGTEE